MRKNVLFIAVDDLLNVIHFRETFGLQIQSPNIDRLIERGVSFENAQVTTPKCKPVRANVMSGESSWTHSIFNNSDAELFDLMRPQDTLPGWFSQQGYHSAGKGKVFHDRFDPRIAGAYDTFAPVTGWDERAGRGINWGVSSVSDAEMEDGHTAAWASEFLESYAGPDPFFLTAGIFKPHLSWFSPQNYYDPYDTEDIVVPDVPEDD